MSTERVLGNSFKGHFRCVGRDFRGGTGRERGAVAEPPQAGGQDRRDHAAALVGGHLGRVEIGELGLALDQMADGLSVQQGDIAKTA